MTDMTITQFLDSVSAASPTPGGGSVSALAGSLASALVEMVAGLTLGKKGFEALQGELRKICDEAHACRRALEAAVAEDSAAYRSVMDAYRLPRGNEEERERRSAEIQTSLKKATEPPLLTAKMGLRVLGLCQDIVHKGNPSAITDAAVAALMADAALRGGVLNVLVNISTIGDRDYVEKVKRQLSGLEAEAGALREEIMAYVKEKLNTR